MNVSGSGFLPVFMFDGFISLEFFFFGFCKANLQSKGVENGTTCIEGNGSSSGSGPDDQGFATILSIDGGGVRGIIPSVVLTALEAKLQ
ncbi:hypothetical protein H0E87_010639, partial [Populus deltoides]